MEPLRVQPLPSSSNDIVECCSRGGLHAADRHGAGSDSRAAGELPARHRSGRRAVRAATGHVPANDQGGTARAAPRAPLTGVDPATFALRKARAAQSPANPKVASPPPVRPQSRETPGAAIVFNSTSEAGCGNVTPADQAIAVGDASVGVLQVINVCLNVFDKSGNLQAGYPKSFTSFVGLPPGTPTTDPRAIYDWINHRYIVSFIQFDPTQASASSYWISVSTGDNPAGGYCHYNIPVKSVGPSGGVFPLPDFPRLGQDRQAIYLASNILNTPTSYQWEEILVLPKAQMYACAGFSFSFFSDLALGGVVTDTTQPANVFSAGDDPRSEYLVTSQKHRLRRP
jgi:hypothetical protein